RQARLVLPQLLQRLPHAALGHHSSVQPLDLHQAAERRAADDPAVQLQTPELLGEPAQALVQGSSRFGAQRHHGGAQLLAVVLNVARQLAQRRANLGVGLHRRRAARQLRASRGGAEVIVQVDVQQVALVGGHVKKLRTVAPSRQPRRPLRQAISSAVDILSRGARPCCPPTCPCPLLLPACPCPCPLLPPTCPCPKERQRR